jgi:hypothetical protein
MFHLMSLMDQVNDFQQWRLKNHDIYELRGTMRSFEYYRACHEN